jgi:hypothetical protein
MKKASRNEIRFSKAVKSQKVLTLEELKQWSETINKFSPKKFWLDCQSLYYGHSENRFKDLKNRKNWKSKHPQYAR